MSRAIYLQRRDADTAKTSQKSRRGGRASGALSALPQALRRLCGALGITFLAIPSKARWRAAILLPVFAFCFFSFYFSNSLATARGTDPEGSLATARGPDPEDSLATARRTDSRFSFSQASIFRGVAAEVGLRFSHFSGSSDGYYVLEVVGADGA